MDTFEDFLLINALQLFPLSYLHLHSKFYFASAWVLTTNVIFQTVKAPKDHAEAGKVFKGCEERTN